MIREAASARTYAGCRNHGEHPAAALAHDAVLLRKPSSNATP
jgi:hypothetical protein